MNQKLIGEFIATCRKEKNLTQEQLAEKLNVNNRTISRWENGNTMPDYAILKQLCESLNITINELFAGKRIEKENIEKYSDINLDNILKEYYKMKKQKEGIKIALIVIVSLISYYILQAIVAFVLVFAITFGAKVEETTDISKYNTVIGSSATEQYINKWQMDESIFPKEIDNLDVEDFKMVYYNPWDAQYLGYLVVNYNNEEYEKELERLNDIGIDNYKGIYGVTGFSKYKLLAMKSDSYQGFVYAITDGENKIIYVEIIFCNYFMDLDYNKYIKKEYLPDNFDATIDNNYMKKMTKER